MSISWAGGGPGVLGWFHTCAACDIKLRFVGLPSLSPFPAHHWLSLFMHFKDHDNFLPAELLGLWCHVGMGPGVQSRTGDQRVMDRDHERDRFIRWGVEGGRGSEGYGPGS